MNTMQPSEATPQKIGDVTNIARALGILLNTALTYQTTHAVFQRAIEERMPLFEMGMRDVRDITLFFIDSQVRYGNSAIEPGLQVFRDLALKFQKLNVTGLILLPTPSVSDIRGLVHILTMEADAVRSLSLQALLDRDGIRTIRENKAKFGIIPDKSVPPAARTAAGTAAGTTAGAAAKTVAGTSSGTATGGAAGTAAGLVGTPKGFRGGGSAGRTFELDMGKDLGFEGGQEQTSEEQTTGERVFRTYVRNVLGSVESRQTSASQAAEQITQKFQTLLNERVEDVRRESERKVRRLNIVKDIVLQELNSHHLAAIVCDTQLNVLASNELGREMLGGVKTIGKGTPLEVFIASNKERQMIEIDGAMRVAHKILSVEPVSQDGAILISIE